MDEFGGGLTRQEASAGRATPPKILALLERDRSTVDFGDVANDREAEAGARLAGRVEPSAAR